MQVIQIARGDIAAREAQEKLYAGELFLNNINGTQFELYAGTDGVGGKVKIGAEGALAPTDKITVLPDSPVDGALYLVDENIYLTTPADPERPDFYKGDYAFWSTKLGEPSGQWYRINNGGGSATETTFARENTNYLPGTTTVQEALVDIDRHKLAFGGELQLPSDTSNLTYSSLFDEGAKAGYFYVVTETITIHNGADEITYEEGDYLAITSNVITNDAALTVSDCNFEKIPGGTHSADKINYTAGERDTSAGVLYKDTDTTENIIKDSTITSVKGGLDQLFRTKADLDHNGKVPLKQLPDTVLGAMEYQGTYVLANDATTFVLPSETDKTSDDDDTTTNETENEFVKGDYWAYSGPRLAVPNNVRASDNFINSGDYIVYDGDDNWSVINNTSPITGIRGQVAATNSDDTNITEADAALQGTVLFTGKDRDGETGLVEIQTVVDDSTGPTLLIEAPNAALIEVEGNIGDIYKENEHKTLIKSGLNESNNKLNINESDGIVLTGAKDGENNVLPGTAIIQNENTELQGSETDNIQVKLPAKSGTLATEEAINTIVTGNGTDFYIPRYATNDNGDLQLIASPIEITNHDTDDGYEGIIFHHNDDDSDEHTSEIIFRKGDGNNKEVVNTMPYVSGHLLNTNSIIDCGEWKVEDGHVVVTAENEGKFDLGLPTDVNEADYEDALRNSSTTSAEQEEIEAIIVDDC